MRGPRPTPTGRECPFGQHEIIVSKTDLKGKITYCNEVFRRVAGYGEDELLGQPHNLIRHPDMPRCVFQLLWETIQDGREIFAYVLNMAKNGDHYWVLAHVTPSFDATGQVIGYHSNRRYPERSAIQTIEPVYAALKAEEERHSSVKKGMAAGRRLLEARLEELGMDYDTLVFSLSGESLASSI